MVKRVLCLAALSIMIEACSGCQSTGGSPGQRTAAPATMYGVPGPPPAVMMAAPGIASSPSGTGLNSSGAAGVPNLSGPQLSAPRLGP